MKIVPARAESFARSPDPGLLAVLVYGPDLGLVHERAAQIAGSLVPDLADPFRVAEIPSDALKSDPARLADEVAAISMTGGRRVVWLREAGDALAPLLADFLRNPPCAPPQAALVIAEAGELGPRAPLRMLFESAENGAALPCYLDEGAQLRDVIRKTLAAEKVSVSADALEYLADNLGADRMVTRREVEKLAIYAGAGATVGLEDAIACVGDSSALSMDEVGFSAAGGDLAGLDRALERSFLEGAVSVGVLRAVTRHFDRLHQAASAVAAGSDEDSAMAALRPAVFFKDKTRFAAQLRRWSQRRLAAALARLLETEILCKTTGMPDETICRQTLFDLAQQAKPEPIRRA